VTKVAPLFARGRVGGAKMRIHCFALRLKYARFVAVSTVEGERVETVETVVYRLARSFTSMGVFEPPPTVVQECGVGRDAATPDVAVARTAAGR
jgi:hypothetical protein